MKKSLARQSGLKLVAKLNDVFANALRDETNRRTGQGYYVVDGSGKRYEGEGFFLCGFNYLKFRCNNPANRNLKTLLTMGGIQLSPAYGGGFHFKVGTNGYSNGRFELVEAAYSAVADYLCGLGYDVFNDSRLD